MNHLIQNGKQIVVAPAQAVAAGQIVEAAAGKVYGVAHADIPAGAEGVVDLEGKYELAKPAAAVALGDLAYYGDADSVATSGTAVIGVFAADAPADAPTAPVFFDGLAPAKA